MLRYFVLSLVVLAPVLAETKGHHVRGRLIYNGKPLKAAAVGIRELNLTTFSDENGKFDLYPVKRGQYALAVTHGETVTESYDIFVKRDFFIEKELKADVPRIRSELMPQPFFTPTSMTYDTGATVAKAVTVFGLSPQYYTFLPSSAKIGVLFEPPVIRSQNPLANGYVMEGLVMDMPFHALGIYGTANLRYTSGVSVSRGVYSVAERDAQGAALVETHLGSGKEARNSFEFYANPALADAAAHYHITDRAWGTVAVRRTILEGYFSADSPTPAAIDYQTKNVFRIDNKSQVELVALGADDSIPLTGTQTISARAHAQRLKYRRVDGAFVYELDFKNRYSAQSYIVLSGKKNITSLTPRLGFYFGKEHYAEAGVDLFYEGSSAQFLQGQSIGTINLDQLKSYNVGGYDAGTGFTAGGYALYRGRLGRFGGELSSRLDKYREYESLYSANAIQLYYEFIPRGKIYAGASNNHRRAEPFKSISLLGSTALLPESNYKAEAGVGFSPFSFLKLNATLFHTRWQNLIALRSDTASTLDISNTNIYKNNGSSQTTGAELAAVLQFGKYYARTAYTYQHMPGDDAFAFYYRRHIWNTAFIYLSGPFSHTAQVKVWSLSTGLSQIPDDALNPAVQLDYRFSIQAETGVFFVIEVGQILNLPWKYLSNPTRNEYYDPGALGNAFLGAATRSGATDETPIHLNLAAGLKL